MITPKMLLKWIPVLAALMLWVGCTTPHRVRVDALAADARHSQPGTRYVLRSGLDGMPETDLFFREVASQLSIAMQQRGFVRVEDGAPFDIEVFLQPFLSQPLTEAQTRTDPIFVETRGYTQVISVPVVNSAGQVVSYVHRTIYSPPRTEWAGNVNRTEQVTVYDKVLRLSARLPAAEAARGVEVWSLSVALRNRSTDYRGFLPYLLTAAAPHIGKRTEGEIIVEIPPDDPAVSAFR